MLGHEFKRLIGYEQKGDSNLSELLGMSFVEEFRLTKALKLIFRL